MDYLIPSTCLPNLLKILFVYVSGNQNITITFYGCEEPESLDTKRLKNKSLVSIQLKDYEPF